MWQLAGGACPAPTTRLLIIAYSPNLSLKITHLLSAYTIIPFDLLDRGGVADGIVHYRELGGVEAEELDYLCRVHGGAGYGGES